jgi:hypothetical protein
VLPNFGVMKLASLVGLKDSEFQWVKVEKLCLHVSACSHLNSVGIQVKFLEQHETICT